MKTFVFVVSLIVMRLFSGCVVTGNFAYTDPETGATANIGVTQNVDAKTIKKLRNR